MKTPENTNNCATNSRKVYVDRNTETFTDGHKIIFKIILRVADVSQFVGNFRMRNYIEEWIEGERRVDVI